MEHYAARHPARAGFVETPFIIFGRLKHSVVFVQPLVVGYMCRIFPESFYSYSSDFFSSVTYFTSVQILMICVCEIKIHKTCKSAELNSNLQSCRSILKACCLNSFLLVKI